MEELIVWLIGIAIALVLLYFFVVYIVLPVIGIILVISGIALAGVAVFGALSGIIIGTRNFFETLTNAHRALKTRP